MRLIRLVARLGLALFAAILGVSLVSAIAAALMRPRLADDAEPADDDLVLNAVYTGRDFRSQASALRGGRIVCWYSGMDVDLRGATLDPSGGDLEVWTVFGGTRIRVPEEWAVSLRGAAVFGGAESATTPAELLNLDAPTLVIRHRTLFGGLDVEATPDDPADDESAA